LTQSGHGYSANAAKSKSQMARTRSTIAALASMSTIGQSPCAVDITSLQFSLAAYQ
jgi:hypothetical protein